MPEDRSFPWVTWGPADALRGLAVGIVVGFLLAPAVVLPFDPELESLGAVLVAQVLLAITLLAVSVVMGPRGEGSVWSRLGLRPFSGSAVGWAILGYLAFVGVLLVYATVITEPEQRDVARDLGLCGGVFGAVASGVLIVGAAPISEEVFFRGFLFGGLARGMPTWLAAVISGALFGLPHLATGAAAVPPLAILGVILAFVYWRTGSLWPSIGLHMLNNGIAFAATSSC